MDAVRAWMDVKEGGSGTGGRSGQPAVATNKVIS